MAYQPLTFSAGERLTSTKMNQMAANDAAFHDGSGIDDEAISTSKIAPQGVTLPKIDASTLKGSFLPVATSSFTTYGQTVYLFRIANLVIAHLGNPVAFIGTDMPRTSDGGQTAVVVPSGFRPSTTVTMATAATVDVSGNGSFIFSPSGEIRINANFSIAAPTRLNGSSAWLTNDDWPESS